MDQMPRPRWQLVAVAFAALAALAYATIAAMLPPAPAAVDAPAERFSAGRAFEQVSRIGERVHPVGSKALFAVRADIEAYLHWLGLRVEVQDAVGATEAFGRGAAMARVHNVIATMPGTDPTGRVVLVAHYDSAEVSHGANDDGAGVATLLETARAMMFGTRPRNDVVFLFTDAEEACLCGAEAFVSQHPYGADGGVVLNVEARGSVGPVIMFETTEGNAGVVAAYAGAAEHPVATSFAVEVYRILPNDTDFTPLRTSGRFTGLNAAYIDGSSVYHSPDDVPATVDRGALQQHGDNALALTRALAAADLTTLAAPSSGDLTYFPVLGTLARYPGTLVWPFAALAALAVVGLAALARWRRRPHLGAPELGRGVTTWPRVLGGFGAALVPLLLTPPAAQGLWSAFVAIRPDYADMIDPWRPGWYRAAVLALVATILLAWYGLLRRRLGGWALALGALLWLAVLGCALAAATPGGSYLAAIPALSVAAGVAVSLTTRRAWLVLLLVWLGVAGAVVVLAPTIALFFPALGLATAAAPALFALLLGFAVLPLVAYSYPPPYPVSAKEGSALWDLALPRQGLRHVLPAVVAGVLTIAFAGYGLLTDPVGEHPRPAQLTYALDAGTGQAWWASRTHPNPWTAQYVTGRANLSAQFPMLAGERWTGPAEAADLAAPTVEVLADQTSETTRTLDLVVSPQRESRAVHLRLTGAAVISATADGRDVPAAALAGDTFELIFFAPPHDGLTVRLQVSGTAPLQLRLTDASIGLDGLPGFVPRPPGIGVAAGHDAELVLVSRTYNL